MKPSPASLAVVSLKKAARGGGGEELYLIHGCFHGCSILNKDYDVWARNCRKAGFRGSILGVHWESLDYAVLLEDLASALAKLPISGWGFAVDLGASALKSARERWADSREEAVAAGRKLADMLCSRRGSIRTVLMGHSLGCRLVKACLEGLAGRRRAVERAFLLGAAVPAGESWRNASRGVRVDIANYYSEHDAVLKMPYHAAELLTRLSQEGLKKIDRTGLLKPPAGLRGIDRPGRKIVNVDVSWAVSAHDEFEKKLAGYLKF